MMDVFDVFAFVVFAVLLAAAVIVVVTLGKLPGQIAHERGHPQAAAVNAAGWLGIATLGVLWPLALIWAFLKPSSAVPRGATPQPAPGPDSKVELVQVQARVTALEAALRELRAGKEMAP